jgi:tripartite-type tricarboxylate transporter receptor subunit TctC
MIKTIRQALFASLVCALPMATASAQDYPNREIKSICGFPAGSGADVLVRYFSAKLQDLVGKPVIVENKSGASSAIAAEYVARAKPDGYTIFITGGGPLTANMHVFKQLRYDPTKDFQPVSPILIQPFILVVDPKLPVKTVADLTARLKAKGDKNFYAGPSVLPIANAEMYKAATGVQAEQVLYRTAAEALQDVQAGTVELFFSDPVFAVEQIKAGKLKALAVTTPTRVSALPDLPTMAEVGIPDVNVISWWSLWMPAGAPPEVVSKLHGWMQQILKTEETKTFLTGFGGEAWLGTPETLKAHHVKEVELWKKIAQVAKLQQQ